MTFVQRVIRGDATKEQAKDTGMALVLVLLLLTVFRKQDAYLVWAVIIHVVAMTAPALFKIPAVLWFSMSHLLGVVVSRVLMAVIFFAVVTPIAWIRRLFGADTLKLRSFKADRGSVMVERNHTFAATDLEQPY